MRWTLVIAAAVIVASVARAQSAGDTPPVPRYVISIGSGNGQPKSASAPVALVLAPAPTASPLPSAAPPVASPLPMPAPANPMPNYAPPTAPPPLNAPAPAPAHPAEPAASAESHDGAAIETPAPNMLGGYLAGSYATLRAVDPSLRVPLIMRGPVAIGENESARPQDRLFATFDYFNNTVAYNPGGRNLNFDVYRETFGFEKTFLDGDASVELRVPVIQRDNFNTFQSDGFGALTVVTKYAVMNNHTTGDAVSVGLAVTAPTGRDIVLATNRNSTLDAWLLQPWTGFVMNSDRLYVQGFTSVIIPTVERDVTLLTADLGVGYKIPVTSSYLIVTQVAPTVELHWYRPLNHTGTDGSTQLVAPTQFVVTGGVNLTLGCRSTLAIGAALPFSGPSPYDWGLLCRLNVRF